ncbi:MAG: hypothetical protein ISR54_01070 [Chlorobium phaeobacteroides]|uniref:Uncharacterized protein n=1 Tax=Chlorobium phaeobacteroides (strain BS1) TaxID=331678 RepID=B3EMX6_CHLPB|nr:hypothetical protein [Chlorobium phaeobacteroides]MBL6955404.1 hypothetical protein [Chlorobium phaeobacteroides]
MKSTCPCTGLPVLHQQHWKADHHRQGYSTKFSLIGHDIIHGEIVSNEAVVMEYIDKELFMSVLSQNSLSGKPFNLLFDLSQVEKISFTCKKSIVDFFYNSGPPFKTLVLYSAKKEIVPILETFASIAPSRSSVVISSDYREAMDMILKPDAERAGSESEATCTSEDEEYRTLKKEFFSSLAKLSWLDLLNHPMIIPDSNNPLYPYFKALEAFQQDLREMQRQHMEKCQERKESFNRKITDKAIQFNAQTAMNNSLESQLDRKRASLTNRIESNDAELRRLKATMNRSLEPSRQLINFMEQAGFDEKTRKQITELLSKLADSTEGDEHHAASLTPEDAAFIAALQQKHPSLTERELKTCLLIKYNHSNNGIANALGVNPRGAESLRYRLHKKLGLEKGKTIKKYLFEIETDVH